MATGGGRGGRGRASGGTAARRERDTSPSMAEMMMDAMVYTHYDSDSGELMGHFSPRMAMYNMGVDVDDLDADELDADYLDEYGASDNSEEPDNGPLWEGGGFDCQFVSEVPSTLQCLICTMAAREAQQVSCCGKVFCKGCLRKLMRAPKKACPNCRKEKLKSFSDKKSDREIESLMVKCSNEEHGCKWEGELRHMQKHVKECSTEVVLCKYQSIGCKVKVVKKDLSLHEEACAVEHLKMAVQKVNQLTRHCHGAVVIPPTVLKMSKFAQHKDSQVIWDSPAFYTHSRGYKLYLQVNAFGEDSYGQQCIGVTVCVLHGEQDDNLVWPFRGIVKFRLLNQDRDEDHRMVDAKFLERKESSRNKRVTAEEGKSIVGWGDRSLLLFSDPMFSCYVQKDCLYFSVDIVEVSIANKPWLI